MWKVVLVVFIVVAMPFAFGGCESDSTGPESESNSQPVTDVSFDVHQFSIEVGHSRRITPSAA